MKKFFDIKTILAIICLIVLQFVILSNSSFTVWPEMVIYPYLLNNGYVLYRDIINPYFPLLPVILSGYFSLFGLSIPNLIVFTYGLIILSDIVLISSSLIIFRSTGKALSALLVYIFLQYGFGGNGLWFELALVPLVIFGLTLIYKYPHSKKYLIVSGLLLGLAGLIKQNSFFFVVPAALFLLTNKNLRNVLVFLASYAVVVLVMLGVIYLNNLFDDFWQWAVVLPLNFSSKPGFVYLPALKQYLFILFPSTAALGLLFSRTKLFKDKLFWILVIIISTSFAFPRYENFHLQVLAAVAALLTGFLTKKLFVVFICLSIMFFSYSVSGLWHKPNRFLDSQTATLTEKIKPYSSVYLLNSPDLAFYFADKLPPKPWAINFPWYFEGNNLSQRVIYDLNNQPFEYVVVADPLGGGKFELGNYLPEEIIKHIEKNYEVTERFGQYNIWKLKK